MDKFRRCILFSVIPAGIFYCIAILALKLAGFTTIQILRDTAQQTEVSSFLGFLSNIGVWLWVSSAAICFYSAFSSSVTLTYPRKELLLLTGTLSLILAVDDFFMIHDRYVNERICYLFYAVCGGLLLLRHYKTILEIDSIAFLLAGSLLAMSILTDLVQDHIPIMYVITQIFEEGFKFLGVATWLYFICRISSSQAHPASEKVSVQNLAEE
ncbi:MAG: hypothetical protein V3V05_07005 [Pontiella sp.]